MLPDEDIRRLLCRVVRIIHLDFHDRSQTSFICLDACLGVMSQLGYFDMTTLITCRIQQSSRVHVVSRFFMIGRNRVHIYFAVLMTVSY